jgi:DhnA family fructose-bisphosphate aldolase class Ia
MVVLAADHRARGVMTLERYADYLDALKAALPACDGILATVQPMGDLQSVGALAPPMQTYLSINRAGLAGSVFELDDRLVAPVATATELGYTGIKLMTRIDLQDRDSSGALELLGRVLFEARQAGLAALIEPLSWRQGDVDRSTKGIIYAAVIAHDMGAPLIKVPVPSDAKAGHSRVAAVRRVVESVGVPVLFLGGPRNRNRVAALTEIDDAMAGGGTGVAIGRAVYQDPRPAAMARLVAQLVRRERDVGDILAEAARLDASERAPA